jgi:tetratricopeptide (TPR) repeat protein
MNNRLAKLQALLAASPNDAFLLYGIAMEHKKLKNYDEAVRYFHQAITADPNYAYAHYQIGQTHELRGDAQAAKAAYEAGIAAAVKSGDAHARGEIETALSILG